MSAIAPPRPEERTIPNYRQQLKKALPAELFKPDYVSVAWYPVHFAFIVGSWWLLATSFSWWLAPILAVVIGHSFGCMGFVAHDIAHGGAYRRLWVRDILSGIGFSPLGIGPLLWRKWHNAEHHTNTQVPGVDPDHLFTMEDYEKNPILQWLYRLSPLARNLVIFSSFSYRMTQQTIRMMIAYLRSKDVALQEKAVIVAQFAVPVALWAGAAYWMAGPIGVLWGYVIPLMVCNAIVICYIATNHFLNPLDDHRDVLATSLTVTLPRGLKWLDPWHSYFGAHVAHHLFPQASARHARAIEAKVAEMFPDRYHSMPITKALKLLWDTPWVYEDHTTFIDPHRDQRAGTLGHGLKTDD